MVKKLAQIEQARARQFELYGDVRDIIHGDLQGHKFVAVWNELHYSTAWKTFPDFLFSYIKTALNRAFGTEWACVELTRPVSERHPILRWYGALCRLQARAKANLTEQPADGIFETPLDGPSAAYLSLAYDLYTMAHNNLLDTTVVRRLKNRLTFRAARYELTVAATMLRAGFSLEYEDESDTSRRHPEFTATHKTLHDLVAVEAKSKWRRGVVEWKLDAPIPDDFRLNIRDLLQDAIDKDLRQPLIVFINANMPPEIAWKRQEVWLKEVSDLLYHTAFTGVSESGVFEGVPFTLLALTNFPHDYAGPGEADPGKIVFTSSPTHPRHPFAHPELRLDVERALRQYGAVPQALPELP